MIFEKFAYIGQYSTIIYRLDSMPLPRSWQEPCRLKKKRYCLFPGNFEIMNRPDLVCCSV